MSAAAPSWSPAAPSASGGAAPWAAGAAARVGGGGGGARAREDRPRLGVVDDLVLGQREQDRLAHGERRQPRRSRTAVHGIILSGSTREAGGRRGRASPSAEVSECNRPRPAPC